MAVFEAAPGLPQLSSGVWYGWTFLVEPLIGVFFNPMEAFFSAIIGVMAGHLIGFRGDMYEFVFALGAPRGASVTSLAFRGRLAAIAVYYLVSPSAYFLSPNSLNLPHWALWDTYLAFVLLMATLIIRRTKTSRTYALIFSALVGLEADILLRILIFVPLSTYKWLYGFPVEFIQAIWVVSTFVTPIQVGLGSMLTLIVGNALVGTIDVLKEYAP